MPALRIPMFAVPLTRAQAQREALCILDAHREAVQASLCAGAGLDGAHAAARPLLDRARSVLREAGFTAPEVLEVLALAREGQA